MPTNCSVIKAERPQLPFEDVGFFDVLTTTDFTKWLGPESVSGALLLSPISTLLSGNESLPFCALWIPSGYRILCPEQVAKPESPRFSERRREEPSHQFLSLVTCWRCQGTHFGYVILDKLSESLRQEVGSPTGLTWGLMLSCLWGVWSRTLWHLQPVTREETRSEL